MHTLIHQPSVNRPLVTTNYRLLLSFLFIVLPFLDAINGFLVVKGIIASAGIASPSQLGRLLVSILLVYLLIVKKLGILPLFLFVYLLTVEVLSGLYHLSPYGFTYGVISAYKLGYLVFLTIILKHYTKTTEGFLQLIVYVKYNLIIIASLLYFSTLTGIGNSTYGFGFGTKSFFASGNGLGLYLGVGALILMGLKYYKLTIVSQKTLLFLVCSIALIGSKTALVLCAVNLICMVLLSKYRISLIVLLSLLAMFFLPKIVESLSLIFDVILKRLTNSDNVFIYLGSGRIDYVTNAFDVFFQGEPSPFRYIFGMGAYTSFQNPLLVNKFDTLETDLFDLFFMYGFLSVIAFTTMIGAVLFNLRKYKVLFLGMLLLSLHSIIAGHVLFNGMSSVTFALFICISSYLPNKRRLNDKIIA
jgi:hypothetical protein